jgi:hypothetical protein
MADPYLLDLVKTTLREDLPGLPLKEHVETEKSKANNNKSVGPASYTNHVGQIIKRYQ